MLCRCPLLAEAVEELGFKVGKDLRDFNFRGTDGSRGHLYDTMRSQDEVFGQSAGPFVSKVHEANRCAINFARYAKNGVLQQPRL